MSLLERELTSAALCWRLERSDGVALGFTSHDRDLMLDGLVYRAAPGMLPSAVALSDGFEADGLDVKGALTSDAIGAADLAAGRWDGAALAIFIADWEDPAAEPVALAEGVIGDVTVKSGGFEAELRGPAAALERQVAEQTSPECRAELGDKRCRVDMAGRTRLVRVTAVAEEIAIEVSGALEAGAWAYGRARWISGANSGLEVGITGSEGSRLLLRDPPPFPAAAGDLIEIAQGCDRSLATCSGRFANARNFRGEPHLPGMDLLTRYPGA
jgi:uncharacterized phage protein (TIGR02218 family)